MDEPSADVTDLPEHDESLSDADRLREAFTLGALMLSAMRVVTEAEAVGNRAQASDALDVVRQAAQDCDRMLEDEVREVVRAMAAFAEISQRALHVPDTLEQDAERVSAARTWRPD